MSPELHKLIQLLQTQLGYSEQGGGYTKFGDWYGKTVEFDSDYSAQPWCDMFLSWAARQLGYEKWFGQFAYTVGHAEWFVEHHAWGSTPEPGALVFFDWSAAGTIDGIDHVGIVTSVAGDTIHTIEGNTDGQYAREKVRDQTFVVGYGYPDKVKAGMSGEPPAVAASSTGPGTGGGPAEVSPARLTALSLAAAESPIPATGAVAMSAPPMRGGIASPALGTTTLAIPLLIAALVLIAYFKVQSASVRLALASASAGRAGHRRAVRGRTP